MVLKTLMKGLLKEEQAGLRQPRRNVEALRDQQQQETTTTPRPYGTKGGNSITGASVSWNPGKKAHAVGDVDTEGCSHYQESGPKQRGGQGNDLCIRLPSNLLPAPPIGQSQLEARSQRSPDNGLSYRMEQGKKRWR